MRTLTLSIAVIAVSILASFTKPATLKVSSPAFTNNSPIPVKYTCMGAEFSPPLHIDGIPAGARSLAIVVFDPDAVTRLPATTVKTTKALRKKNKYTKANPAPKTNAVVVNGYTHWVMWNIDVAADIPENYRNDHVGLNGAMQRAYKGMCPQTGSHHFQFIVYALDTQLNIPNNTDKAGLEKVMEGHILGKGLLVGTFDKNYR